MRINSLISGKVLTKQKMILVTQLKLVLTGSEHIERIGVSNPDETNSGQMK